MQGPWEPSWAESIGQIGARGNRGVSDCKKQKVQYKFL